MSRYVDDKFIAVWFADITAFPGWKLEKHGNWDFKKSTKHLIKISVHPLLSTQLHV